MTAIASYMTQNGLEGWLHVSDIHDLERAVRRLLSDLAVARSLP